MTDAQPEALLPLLFRGFLPAGRLHGWLLGWLKGAQQLVGASHHQPVPQQWVQQQHHVLPAGGAVAALARPQPLPPTLAFPWGPHSRGHSHQAHGGIGVPGYTPQHAPDSHGPHAAGSGHLPEP